MSNKSKTLAGLGMRTLDDYVDSLPAHEQQPVIDDTFNDDTVAQTFGVLENMRKIICLHCGLDYQLYHNRVSIERDGMLHHRIGGLEKRELSARLYCRTARQ